MINYSHWWASFPMLRILLPCITGMLLYQPYNHQSWIISGTLTCLLLLVFIRRRPLFDNSSKLLRVVPIVWTYFILGYYLMHFFDIRNQSGWLGSESLSGGCYIGQAQNTSRPSKNNFSTEFRLNAAKTRSNKWHPVSAFVRLSHKGPEVKEGYTVIVSTDLSAITRDQAKKNGFLNYLIRRNIYHVSPSNQVKIYILDSSEKNTLIDVIRTKLSATLDSLFNDQNVRAFSGALLIGERSTLDDEIKNAYSRTGVVHVIAISGMHLALIYAMLAGLLRFLKKGSFRWLFTLLCLGILWMYTYICGNSPSIARSAWMFSFLLIGDQFNKPTLTGNNLCAAALIMLCSQPSMLWDIGFQLSFAAVGSLLVYQEPIKKLYRPKNKALRYSWEMTATTIAAQILTTPLVIYHFNQFSLVFLLSNLVAVPLSGLILLLLGISCLLFPLNLSAPFVMVSQNLIHLMNGRIFALSDLEFAAAEDLNLDVPDTVALYVLILTLTLWIRSKKR
ncbi:MAG: ComEC/Rec2 family competence protein [Sphingobacteriales bacterium]|nr:MAG: ComEC/Rec2 family competence protein [Sphingobacteriales bacterium]